MTRVLNFLSIVLSWLVAGASVCALALWPHWWLPGAALLFAVTWVAYLAVMNLAVSDRVGSLVGHPRQLGMVLLVGGYVLDYLLNAAVFTLLTLRPPMETTVTERLNKHAAGGGWPARVARYFGAVWLNPFDHSGKPHVNLGDIDG